MLWVSLMFLDVVLVDVQKFIRLNTLEWVRRIEPRSPLNAPPRLLRSAIAVTLDFGLLLRLLFRENLLGHSLHV
jgi:hypothetical protein